MIHRLTLFTRLAEIDRARGLVAAFRADAGLDSRAEQVLTLIIEELVTNTVAHGGGEPEDRIELVLERVPGGVMLRYEDEGRPFDPSCDLPADDRELPLEERRSGGLGWPMINAHCRCVAYRRESGRNRLQLLVDLP